MGEQTNRHPERVCCFTGHRDIPTAHLEEVKRRLYDTVEGLIREGVTVFLAGGARGFDTLAAQTVLELKERYGHIRLALLLPCKDQTRGWNREDVMAYNDVLDRADRVKWLSETYYPGCMHTRNRQLVDYAGVCVCYLTAPTGGTAYTVRYAKKQGRRIYSVAPTDSVY